MSDQTDGSGGQSDKPKFLSGATGWIGGLTALVVAFTGLLKACDEFAPAEEPKVVTNAATPANPAPAAEASTSDVGEAGDAPVLYTGEGIKLEWVDNNWSLTDKQGTYPYEEMVDPTGENLMAFNKDSNSYLRWPEKGGTLQESLDDKKSWASLGEIAPSAE